MNSPRVEHARPDPDVLLAEMRQQERRSARGKLKVFFGAAPGVGKTFAMLEEGRARTAEGADVVVGYAEPHARTDTEALLLGMEILPYKVVDYKNVRLKEFDLDAAIARRPALLLIDELAHTNAPGSRHPKRWQDVAEVLDAGIDVYTTLNVQHLESVNDIVERVTGVKVRETLPDSVFEEADEVELVDISPEELLERLSEGKVYTSDTAERATRNFFGKGNLLALRELALRRTAERVDAQMLTFRRAHSVRSTWAATERILVCVGPSPLSARLVRSGKRLASGLRAPWTAAFVDTGGGRLSEADRRRVDQHLRLAEQLGAQSVTLQGQQVADEVIAYAAAHNVTKIVIGKPQRPRWQEWFFGSAVDDLIRKSGDIEIHVIRGEAEAAEATSTPRPEARRTDWRGYAMAACVVALSTLIAWPVQHRLLSRDSANVNVLMLYLLGVMWVATRYSRRAAALASVLAVAAFDFFFVPPYYTFAVSDQQYVFTFLVMLFTALTIGTLTHRVRAQADAARGRERRTETLLALSRELAAAANSDEVRSTIVRHVSEALDAPAAVLVAEPGGRLSPGPAGAAAGRADDPKERSVAEWAFRHGQVAGAGTGTLPAAAGTYLPMKTARGAVGVMAVFQKAAGDWSPEQRQLMDAFASQAAVAVERAVLAAEAREAWERVEAEFLRNTLLSGVSHELRTPLAAITGAASSLADVGAGLPEAARRELLDTICGESERMDRLINNLLDMTRMESGGLVLKKEWHPLQELVGSALSHLGRRLDGREVKIDIPPDLPLVHADGVGIEQVLANLLDNAAEHTPPGTPILIGARAEEGGVVVEVADRGPGIPPGTEGRVFQKFFRAGPERTRRGIGLGLAIAKGIVEAHGGRVTAANRPGGGACFRITLPADTPPPSVDATR